MKRTTVVVGGGRIAWLIPPVLDQTDSQAESSLQAIGDPFAGLCLITSH